MFDYLLFILICIESSIVPNKILQTQHKQKQQLTWIQCGLFKKQGLRKLAVAYAHMAHKSAHVADSSDKRNNFLTVNFSYFFFYFKDSAGKTIHSTIR